MSDNPRWVIETKVTTIGDAGPLGSREEEAERVTLVVYQGDGDRTST